MSVWPSAGSYFTSLFLKRTDSRYLVGEGTFTVLETFENNKGPSPQFPWCIECSWERIVSSLAGNHGYLQRTTWKVSSGSLCRSTPPSARTQDPTCTYHVGRSLAATKLMKLRKFIFNRKEEASVWHCATKSKPGSRILAFSQDRQRIPPGLLVLADHQVIPESFPE